MPEIRKTFEMDQQRPEANRKFWETPDNVKQHIKTTYIDTGKMTETVEFSSDGLSKTVITSFATEADKAEFEADSVLLANAEARKQFHLNNRIVDDGTQLPAL